jgi:hypothetical protein
LEKERTKDKKEINNHKEKMIKEIKSLDKMKMFEKPEKPKISLFKKILLILGYGKKG